MPIGVNLSCQSAQSSRPPDSPPGNEFHGAYSESPLKED